MISSRFMIISIVGICAVVLIAYLTIAPKVNVSTQTEELPAVADSTDISETVTPASPTGTEPEGVLEEEKQAVVTNPVVAPTVISEPVSDTPSVTAYTLAQVAAHNSKASCWTTIGGSVYDITAYVPKHPGGEKKILQVCGKDGSSLFEGQHGGDSKPESRLKTLFIGTLTE